MRTGDDNYVNIARINGGRVWMWHFALQSGRGEFFRSLSTIIRSISAIVFVLIDRTPLIAGQVHSGRNVQLDNDAVSVFDAGDVGFECKQSRNGWVQKDNAQRMGHNDHPKSYLLN